MEQENSIAQKSNNSKKVTIILIVILLVVIGLSAYALKTLQPSDRPTFPLPPATEQLTQPLPTHPVFSPTVEVWNPEKLPITANVLDANKKTNQLRLHFTYPLSMPLLEQDAWITIRCPITEADSAVAFTDNEGNFKEVKKGVDIFSAVGPGTFFTGYCGDSQCQSITKQCVLYKKV